MSKAQAAADRLMAARERIEELAQHVAVFNTYGVPVPLSLITEIQSAMAERSEAEDGLCEDDDILSDDFDLDDLDEDLLA